MARIDSLRKHCAKQCLDLVIHQALVQTERSPDVQDAFSRLLAAVCSRTGLLHPMPPGGRLSWTQPASVVRGLLALAQWHMVWLRDVGTWEPTGSCVLRQFGSLARHLLCTHPVPRFMDRVWFSGRSKEAGRRQKWFRHVGLVGGIRGTDIPVRLTKTMAQHFMRAPDHYTVEAALRWGQILDFGGDAALVDAVVATRLGRSFSHERYWERILRFFVHNAGLLLPHVGAIVEYLDFHKLIFRLEPPLPEKRKTILELLDRVAEWQSPRLADSQIPKLKWHNAGIGNFECQEYLGRSRGVRIWTIRELLDSNALAAEGKVMRHCVGNYGNWCFKRVSSIWSMMCHSRSGQEHVLTIEIDPTTRTIVQAKGKQNSPPSPEARRIMLKWAATKHLAVADGV